jgi:hypothetical protein
MTKIRADHFQTVAGNSVRQVDKISGAFYLTANKEYELIHKNNINGMYNEIKDDKDNIIKVYLAKHRADTDYRIVAPPSQEVYGNFSISEHN